jgi:hypothetical protein
VPAVTATLALVSLFWYRIIGALGSCGGNAFAVNTRGADALVALTLGLTIGAAVVAPVIAAITTGDKIGDNGKTKRADGALNVAPLILGLTAGAMVTAPTIALRINGATTTAEAMLDFNTGAETVTAPLLLIMLAIRYCCTGLAKGAQNPA